MSNDDDIFADLRAEEAARAARLAAPAVPLFGPGDDYTTQAWVDDLVASDAAEADGFKEAAQALVEAVQRNDGYADTLVFPIVFCYRHYLELTLKTIVRYAQACGHVSAPAAAVTDALNGHFLHTLWALVLEALQHCPVIPTDQRIVRASLRIDEWNQHDPASFAYRYSRSKKGTKRVLPAGGPQLDLVQFREGMDDLADTLNGLTAMYDQYLEWLAEQQAEANY